MIYVKGIISLFSYYYNRFFYIINPIGYAKRIGVSIGENCRFVGDVTFSSEPYLVSLGNHVSITNSDFITHDGAVWVYRDNNPEIDLLGQIKVGSNVFIGAKCTILPNTIIEDDVIVGAGSIVKGRLIRGHVYAGVPVKKICTKDEYFIKNRQRFSYTKCYSPKEKELFCRSKIIDN